MKIQVKRGTASALKTANPVLASGEFCRETDTGFIKCGDGTTAWNSLQYIYPSDYDSGEQKNSVFDPNCSNLGTISSSSQMQQFLNDNHVTTGKFGNLKLNNCITIAGSAIDGSNADWLISGFNYWYNYGPYAAITKPHLALIPKVNLGAAVMNDTNTTVGGYIGSKMHTVTMPAISTKLRNKLGSYILQYSDLFSSAMDASRINRYGSASGASTSWTWDAAVNNTYCELMSEPQVYGCIAWSSSGYDIGCGNRQLPIFKYITPVRYSRSYFWLRAVASSTDFAYCHGNGSAYYGVASYSCGVRPLIFVG